jgi:DNA-binding NtrC family response regulator
MKANVLLVDDDQHMRIAIKESLSRAGYAVSVAEDGVKAIGQIGKHPFDLVITDVKMPEIGGMEILKHIKRDLPYLPVILITAYGTVQDAVKVIKEGAFDYIQKPFDKEALYKVIERALGARNGSIVCESKAMKDVFSRALRIAGSDETVLLTGESGVGKEVVARYIHENSTRKDNPFIGVNCAALPDTLLESELFGYEKGAFTGANTRKPGKFEVADKGTILLDEVTEIDLRLQAKLLRVLQEKELEVLGGKASKKIDARVIATTNRDIRDIVREGKLRQDLYYRLNVLPVHIPALRERKDDIPELVACFLKKYSKGMDIRVEEKAMEYLMNSRWDGNVRELENVVARACVLSNYSVIKKMHLEEMYEGGPSGNGSIRDIETRMILDTLRAKGGNRTRAAVELGINVRTLRNKLREFREEGIEIPGERN